MWWPHCAFNTHWWENVSYCAIVTLEWYTMSSQLVRVNLALIIWRCLVIILLPLHFWPFLYIWSADILQLCAVHLLRTTHLLKRVLPCLYKVDHIVLLSCLARWEGKWEPAQRERGGEWMPMPGQDQLLLLQAECCNQHQSATQVQGVRWLQNGEVVVHRSQERIQKVYCNHHPSATQFQGARC